MSSTKSAISGLLVTIVCSSLASGSDGPLAHWQFDQAHFQEKQFRPLAGKLPALPVMPARFAEKPPHALIVDGNSKALHRIRVTDDIAAAGLPAGAITVEAWVLIDQPLEWGGIAGAIQDNGNYERGWILGYNNSHFYFAIASQKTARLAYLGARDMYQTGYWYHVVGTYDGREQRIYVDGKLQSRSTSQRGDILYPPKASFTLAAYHDDNELYSMDGQIETISVWARALDEDEIKARFGQRKARFPEIDPVPIQAVDWPTYLRDNLRTAATEQPLQLPLKLAWRRRLRNAPSPAWPPPAGQDFWHKKQNLKARVTYDHFFHLVSVGQQVYFGSSADDQLVCLDARSGRVKWRFFAEAPIRLAPTITGNRVLFGADDGVVYCLDAEDGSLLWEHRRHEDDQRIAGNGRIMSRLPVRTGVLVEGQTAYFCKGIFPSQSVTRFAVDVATGKTLSTTNLDASAQGYLERRAGRLYVATGRDLAGRFATELQRRGKDVGKPARSVPAEYPFAFAAAGNQRFGGGVGRVAAFDSVDGRQLWATNVVGRAGSIAISAGRLLVSTDAGYIYCFSPDADQPQDIDPDTPVPYPYANAQEKARYESLAGRILKETGLQETGLNQGYALVLDCGEGQLPYELARRTRLKVVGLERDPVNVATARSRLAAAGLYGRVVVHPLDSEAKRLPYTSYLFNLVVRDLHTDDAPSRWGTDEIMRVVRPFGGVFMTGKDGGTVQRRGPLDGTGQWSHLYADPANTACSEDQLVKGPFQLQWFGPPGPQHMIDRHHRTVAPLWKNGRLFVPGNNRVTALDAYNGTVLWDLEVPESRRMAAMRDCGSMAATDNSLCIASGNSCWELDAATGTRRHAYGLPGDAAQPRDWGLTVCVEDLLLGSVTARGGARREHSLATIREGTYSDFRPTVTSDGVFAYDRTSKKLRWNHRPTDRVILNPTITVGGGRVYFVAARHKPNDKSAPGRVLLSSALSTPADIVALDLKTGGEIWRRPMDLSAIQHHLFGGYAEDVLVLVGSRNNGTDSKKAKVWYDIHAIDARSGQPLWQQSRNNQTKIGGDHGEQDHHPVIVGNRLYAEPHAYDLKSGARADWGWKQGHRRGCGTMSASACALFFRDKNPSLFDLQSQRHDRVTLVTRPGCWINMIPAGGLLLIPEASSGCTCDFAVQTSLALLPVASAVPSAKDTKQ